MLKDLFPEYKYQRLTARGIVILKANWWSFKKTILNITDLYIDQFPKRIAAELKLRKRGDAFMSMFNNDIYVMMQLRAYKKEINIVDYMWKQYNVLLREVVVLKTTTSEILVEIPSERYLPVLSPVSSYYIPGVEKLLRKMMKDPVESLVEKISKIKLRIPQRLVNVVQIQLA